MPGVYHVIATSTGDPTATGVATVTVRKVSLRLNPEKIGLRPGASFQFGAVVEGSQNTAVAWSIKEGASETNGTVDSNGTYTAPETLASGPVTVHVRATSAADPLVQKQAEIIVNSDIELKITVHPAVAYLTTGESMTLHATVEHESADNVTWVIERLQPNDDLGEAVLAGNFLLGGPRASHFRVRATSRSNPSVSATGEVYVANNPGFTLKGLVGAAPGVVLDPQKRIMVSEISGMMGTTSRQGSGVYRLHIGNDEEYESENDDGPIFVAWEDAGGGVFRPTLDKWGVVAVNEKPEPGEFVDIILDDPSGELPTEVPAPAKPTAQALDTSVLVDFEALTEEEWPNANNQQHWRPSCRQRQRWSWKR